MSTNIYLDHAATSPLLPDARAAMLEVWDGNYGNASSLHSPGHAATELVAAARFQIARLINAEPEEIIFTSGGSEANNTVAETFRGQTVACSAIEHPSVLESLKRRATRCHIIPVDEWGKVEPEMVLEAARDCDLLSIMLANNELGTIEPIAELTKACKKLNPKLRFHSDATQAFGKIKIDVKALDLDYLTISAHKIGGPIGIGALYVRKDSPYRSLVIGGHQEHRRRAGTTNTALIAGFGAAAKWRWDNWSCKKWAKVADLRDLLKKRILQEIPFSSCNSPEKDCLPNILNCSFKAAEGESIQLYLDAAGISVGTGSACAAGDLRPSHVLMATRHDAEVAHSSIRFSLGLDTDKKDLEAVMQVLPGIIHKLQSISTIKLEEV